MTTKRTAKANTENVTETTTFFTPQKSWHQCTPYTSPGGGMCNNYMCPPLLSLSALVRMLSKSLERNIANFEEEKKWILVTSFFFKFYTIENFREGEIYEYFSPVSKVLFFTGLKTYKTFKSQSSKREHM